MQKTLDAILADKSISRETLDEFNICYYKDGDIYGKVDPLWVGQINSYKEDRLIYPLRDLHGFFKGFAFRSQGIKFFYDTSRKIRPSEFMYGLNKTKQGIQESGYAIIVEGMFDFLKLYDVGIRNVVTTLGTYLSWEQMSLLRRFCKLAIICYDPDVAGREASIKADETLRQGGILPITVTLPDRDPDDFVARYGKEEFLKVCFQCLNNTKFNQLTNL